MVRNIEVFTHRDIEEKIKKEVDKRLKHVYEMLDKFNERITDIERILNIFKGRLVLNKKKRDGSKNQIQKAA